MLGLVLEYGGNMENHYIQIGRIHFNLQSNHDGPFTTYFRNDAGRCLILRGLGMLFVCVLKPMAGKA
jgi:hypothetical protein